MVLRLQLGFAVVPLVLFIGDRRMMGPPFANGRLVAAIGWALVAAIVAANLWLGAARLS